MDHKPSHHDGEFNEDHSDPDQPGNNEAYKEQLDDPPLDDRTDKAGNQFVEETVETYTNQVEPVRRPSKASKAASYYGDGWEERSPPPPATVLLERQRVTLPVVQPSTTYPHISEVVPHWTQFADPHAKKDVPFCKQLAQGGCSQGDGCRFRHSLTVEEYILLFNDQQPNLWTVQRDCVNEAAFSPPASRQLQLDPPHSWPAIVVPRSSIFDQECKFYPIGKCRNGDLCLFQHTQHPNATVLNVDQDWKSSERPTFGTQDPQRPCKYYVELGYCSRGLFCKFRHTGHPDGDHPSSGPSGPESAPSVINDDDKGWSTGWEEGNKANNNNSDVPVEGGGWGDDAAAVWGAPSKPEDHSEWDSPGGNDDGHKAQPRNSNVCFQYTKQGLCRRGKACRFIHDRELSKADNGGWPPSDDSSPSAPWNTGPPAQCPYHLKGNCRNGSFCHMSHDSEEKPQEESQPEESNKPTNGSGETNQHEAQSTWKTEGELKTLHENQSEAHKEDSQDSHILDNEATWSQPWPTETVQSPSFLGKIDAPCMRFGQGYCPFGDDCHYLHIEETDVAEYTSNLEETPLANNEVAEVESIVHDKPDPTTTVELEPIIFDHPVVERHILNCTVRFGINATPDQIMTAADSKKLILSNLPVNVSPTDIQELAGRFGEIHSIISLDETADTARIEVEFAECSQALSAFDHLNGRPFEKYTISANLKAQISMTVRSPDHPHVFKVSWPAPSASAWIHFPTISKAKSEAIRLDGVIVGGLQIKAVCVTPLKRQKDSFAVEIRGLPVDVSKVVLQELSPEQTVVTLNPPCYTQDPGEAIRSALAHCGELEDVDIQSATATRLTFMAFATFKNGEAALEAVEALDGRNQDFLGGQPLTVRPIYYFRHRATIPQFEAVKNDIDRLNERGEKKCSIQYQEQPERMIVWIRIYASAENLATFASLNTELVTLLQGMLLTSNGDAVWDDYLETPSSAKSIDAINTTNSDGPFFVLCDVRTRNVRIFGGKPDQERAEKLVMRMLQKVHKLQHEIQLPRTRLHDLVNGGLNALQDDLGVNKVSLDVANAKLIIKGSPGDASNVENLVGSLDSISTPETTEALCQICHHLPVNPIVLTCRHAYCTLCLQMALRYSPSAPFQCISRDTLEDGLNVQCPANVPYVVIRDILPPAEEKKFLHASFLSHIRSKSKEFFFCPTLNCKSAYRTGVKGLTLRCFFCASEICSFCQTRAHAGSVCKEK
ncbi:hypothetical protein BYT27DRAFT_7074748 [Phlegmacium glaucopus]|nr:hypothetical protein BYT27DRAFT_7074748 [Phlegmacium glaucopus]